MCPMCGHAVRVFGGEEGTMHYEPVEAKGGEALRQTGLVFTIGEPQWYCFRRKGHEGSHQDYTTTPPVPAKKQCHALFTARPPSDPPGLPE